MTLDKNIRVFVNAISFLNAPWQICEDKLFHEVHFDQLFQYLNNALIGFTLFLNFYCRQLVHKKQYCCLLNLVKKEVYPWDRRGLPMRLFRMVYYPVYYHRLLERMNIMHYGLNQYIDKVSWGVQEAYPWIKCEEVRVDAREDKIMEVG